MRLTFLVSALIPASLCLSSCTAVPYQDELPVTPQIPVEDPVSQHAPTDIVHCSSLNIDPATTTVTYTNAAKGISFVIPYNPKWGYEESPLPAYSDHASTDTDPNGATLFGPPMRADLEGLPNCELMQSYQLTYLPARTAEQAVRAIQGRASDIVPTARVTTIGDYQVVRYTDVGLCSYPTLEVVGKSYNYSFTTSCGTEEADEVTYLENIVKSLKLTK